MLVSKGLSKAIYPTRIAEAVQYKQPGTTSADANKYPLAGVRLIAGEQPPLDVSWEDQPEEQVSWENIHETVATSAGSLFRSIYGYDLI